MLQRKTLILLVLCIFFENIKAQSYTTQRNQVFFINVLGNAIMGGIGGAINKGKDEKVYKAFIRNFLKGGVGGVVKYSAKYQTFYLGSESFTNLSSINRLYFFLGHSFVVNASLNRKLLSTYYCNFYGVDIRANFKAEQKIQARVSLATVGSAIYFGVSGFEFDLFRTLEYGSLFFNARRSGPYFGQAVFNCIAIAASGSRVYSPVISHEIVHTYQMYDMFSLSSYYHKKEKTLLENNRIYKVLSKYLVADYQVFFFSALYYTQPSPLYYKNYFEFEAEHFKSRSYIKR